MRPSNPDRPRISGPRLVGAVPFRPRLRILIVDDEPSICAALMSAFTAAGFNPIAAQSGEAALSIVQSEHIDLMLLDLRIPDRRGDMIFESAAAHQPQLRQRTLFMTGDITERAVEHIAACGCNYIQKPFDLDVLVDALLALTPRAHDQAG